MKKPYLKKYCQISKFSVWIVDGKYIRENIDEEFTNFGQHYHFKFIPENEFWIDEEHGAGDEARYFIDNLLVENRLMKKGNSYLIAGPAGDRVEKREREKFERIKRLKKYLEFHDNQEIIKRVHKILLKKYSGKVNVWIVNGRLVRDLFFIDFTEGVTIKFIPLSQKMKFGLTMMYLQEKENLFFFTNFTKGI